jgi:hypothetical protein
MNTIKQRGYVGGYVGIYDSLKAYMKIPENSI